MVSTVKDRLLVPTTDNKDDGNDDDHRRTRAEKVGQYYVPTQIDNAHLTLGMHSNMIPFLSFLDNGSCWKSGC